MPLVCWRLRQSDALLLGTLWSKFVQTTAVALLDPDSDEVNLPRHLLPEAAIGDRYVLVAK